ncbi:MAG: CdaR family protein [Chloroflexota bacterium]
MNIPNKGAINKSPAKNTARITARQLISHLGSLLLSLILGLIIWVIAITQQNPLQEAEFPTPIPVSVLGISEALIPLQELNNITVQLTLKAPQNLWEQLTIADFKASMDLTGLGSGVHDVPITVNVFDPQVEVISIQRPELRLQLDPLTTKAVPVRAEVMDSTAFGYDRQEPIIEPAEVTITGPETQVNEVVSVHTEIYLRNAKSQVERSVRVEPQNSQQQPIDRVAVEPGEVRVIVPVERWPDRKEVAVRVNLQGQPATGYRLSNVRVEPSTVVLLAGDDILAAIPGFVETAPLTINSATSAIEERLELIVPSNVRVLDGNSVGVLVSITPIEGGRTVALEPVLQGLAPSLEASVALETVEVILSGPLPLLESLDNDDMYVILDLNSLLPGSHVVTPRVLLPDGIQEEGFLPETVEVVIVEMPAEASETEAAEMGEVPDTEENSATSTGNTQAVDADVEGESVEDIEGGTVPPTE